MSNRSIVIYGPRACGKTTHADQLRAHFDLETTVDNWDGVSAYPREGALVLTSNPDAQMHAGNASMHFGAAVRALNNEAAR
jgi:tRNA A37 N6-isopentenylltransferase MiaA